MIRVSEAAKLLDGSESWVRSLCRRQIIGDCYHGKMFDFVEPKRHTYYIVPGQLAEYMRISEAELNQRLREVRHELDDN